MDKILVSVSFVQIMVTECSMVDTFIIDNHLGVSLYIEEHIVAKLIKVCLY